MQQTGMGILGRIGELLAYPRGDYRDRLESWRTAPPFGDVEADSLLRNFLRQIQDLPLEQVQELYTHTFDFNPACALEVGWHLYGDEYARGEFLLAMRERLRRHCIAESRELPDHLSNVLSLLDHMEPQEARNFRDGFLIPALNKMLAGLAEHDNPYRYVLLALAKRLSSQTGEGSAEDLHV
ncbi:MAG: nitrate reductase molybdenum cofactor assembly chaperone [Acidobacteria bacterium]|nr:nitrate reductase molybdenum cofactor assembly chaperone [Acidobacteriota bacterium]